MARHRCHPPVTLRGVTWPAVPSHTRNQVLQRQDPSSWVSSSPGLFKITFTAEHTFRFAGTGKGSTDSPDTRASPLRSTKRGLAGCLVQGPTRDTALHFVVMCPHAPGSVAASLSFLVWTRWVALRRAGRALCRGNWSVGPSGVFCMVRPEIGVWRGKDHRVTLPCSLPGTLGPFIPEEDLPWCPQRILPVPCPCLNQALVKGIRRASPIRTHTRGLWARGQGSPSLNTLAQSGLCWPKAPGPAQRLVVEAEILGGGLSSPESLSPGSWLAAEQV